MVIVCYSYSCYVLFLVKSSEGSSCHLFSMVLQDPQSGSRHPLESAASEGMVWRWMPYSPGGPPLHSPGEFSVPVDQGSLQCLDVSR